MLPLWGAVESADGLSAASTFVEAGARASQLIIKAE
jgi:hypothetical protein